MNSETISKAIFEGAKNLINRRLPYLSGRNSFTPSSVEENRIRGFKGVDDEVSISKAVVDKYASCLAEGYPVHIEQALEASGSQRSALEALVSHLPNAGYISDGSVPNRSGKHVLWSIDCINSLGNLTDISENWRSLVKPSSMKSAVSILTTRLSRSLLAKPFLILAGPSGSGKTRGAIDLARFLCEPDCRSIIAVGADWTDSRHVVGYLNPLQTVDGKPEGLPIYESTEILKLLLHAKKHPDLPHFLILDEMNLSHVERYFNDFLSGMELSDEKKALKLHSAGLAKTREGLDVEGCIDFPENLFVIGTVNIDETTYMFSPKVLDRANVIECRPTITQLKEAAKILNSGPTKGEIEKASEQTAKDFLKLALKAREHSWAAGESQPPERDWEDFLNNLHEMSQQILEPAGLELTYRPQKEILAYARVDYYFHREGSEPSTPIEPSGGEDAQEQKGSEANEFDGSAGEATGGENATASATSGKWDWQRCLDEQIMQKILPKLVGNERKLRDVLGKLKEFCEDPKRIGSHRLSHAKILQMQLRLKTDRFTGYF